MGVDAVSVADHVAIGPDTSGYPFGSFPLPSERPFLEPLSLLIAIATVTDRVRLDHRDPHRAIADARRSGEDGRDDRRALGGRLELGVAVGWHADEYEACGVDFRRRGVVLDDVIGACRALWSGPDATYSSTTASFESLSCIPLPVQERLPVLFAGSLHERNVARIVTTGDGWIPVMGAEPAVVADGVALLDSVAAERGRHATSFLVRCELAPVFDDRGRPNVDATLASIPALLDAGVTDVQFPLPYFVSGPAHATSLLQHVVDGWRSCVATHSPPIS